MPEDQSGLYQAGETLLLVKVPEAEPLVGGWRRRFDSSAGARLPAHVTVLYPFLDHGRIDADVLGALELLVGAHGAFDIRFECFGRFPDVLFLVPTPGGPLRALTQAVCERWPEVPPYGGRFVEVVPHLTVAHGQERSVFDEAEAALTGRLPVTARVSAVQLLVCDGESWHEQAAFPLLGRGESCR
ncbi:MULTISPECIES: 2'-5' RNA ligase family protein [Streptomyces]|uniref:2'-5' RNA ligase family protein n=1 Tax=Streptomyces TaxID=1883 RepID=UPI00207953DD|nr:MULTISPECIES: 2'-5' RNA ligase family protein [Streptomyces]MCM9077974.1 2'-5' RNA ligase family protein [Streptomyces spororaveus]MCX4803250.1 2'-5' RNA ligase family protein [Streptomyces sp. NBC_01214]WSC76151.1 2'-5' RNA ligase family protein [Streptomyces virginiae]